MLFAVASAARVAAVASRISAPRRALMRATAITGGVLAAMLAASPAQAQIINSTWLATPANNNMNNGANWNNGTVPTGSASFGASTITSLTLNMAGGDNIGDFTFAANAPAYTITVGVFRLNGLGLVNAGNLTLIGAGAHDTILRNTATLDAANFIVNAGGIRMLNSSTAGSATITTNFGAALDGGTRFHGDSTGGTSRHILGAQGLLDITPHNSGVTIGSLEGAGLVGIGGKTLTIGSNNRSTTYSGVIQNIGLSNGNAGLAGNLVKTGTGTLTLTGTNTYTGATTVNGGTLLVNGSIATSSGVTVNNGGTIGGTGSLPGATIASGGTLAPGNSVGTLSVNGNLTLNAGATTVIEVQGATADRVNVTGTAALAGTVRFVPLGGTYTFNSPYTFIQAASVTGAFSTQAAQGSFGDGVTTEVTYTATQAQLTLKPASLVAVATQPALAPQSVTGNQLGVATAIDRAVAAGGNASPFFNLFNQNRQGILGGLDQLTGVAHAGGGVIGQQASNTLIGAMFNPAAAGRGAAPGGALVRSFAPEQALSAGQRAISDAVGLPPDLMATYAPASLYTVWASVTGAASRANGEASTGAPRVSSGLGGVAVGVDVRVAPETVVGVALAGAKGSASSARGLGSIETDLFQIGLYGSTKLGALSLAAGGNWVTGRTDGTRAIPVLGVNEATSRYNLQGLSGRFEAAFAVASFGGVTTSPYAAFQAASIRTAAFTEKNALTGAPVGITASANTNVTARAELGLKLETAGQLGSMPATAFIRAGWGLYTSRDSAMSAQLVGLPGSFFTATGVRPDRNVALVAAGGEVQLTSALTLGGRVDAELGARTNTLAGTASLRWAF